MPKNQLKASQKSIKGIPDELFRESKAMAARQGKTIGQLVSEALAYYLHAVAVKPKR